MDNLGRGSAGIAGSTQYQNNDQLRALMLTRGWKVPYVAELLEGSYVKGTVNKWHSRAKPMPDRAWNLLQAAMTSRGLI